MTLPAELGRERQLGRYALYGEIAAGGMATVHFGRLIGPVGFARTCAIKRLHAQFARDPEFVSMFLDEARLAARIQHPNVVSTLDVVPLEGELFLVMEYVQGESLSKLVRVMRQRNERIPIRILSAIVVGALHGLHAAHEAKNERGEPLGIVHRDVSPQNVLVGIDGVARVLDFGVAKAAGRVQTTRDGQIKGKLAYMAPEQIRGVGVDRRTDVYAAGVMLWEALTGLRMFDGDNEANILSQVLEGSSTPPSARVGGIPPELDRVVLSAIDRDINGRFATAREMAIALERAVGIASPYEVGEWVERTAADTLAKRAQSIKDIESTSAVRAIPQGGDQQLVVAAPGQWGDLRSGSMSLAPNSMPASMPGPAPTSYAPAASSLSQAGQVPPKSNGALLIAAVLAVVLSVGVVVAVVVQITSAKHEEPAAAVATHEAPPPETTETAKAPPPPTQPPPAASTAPIVIDLSPPTATTTSTPATRTPPSTTAKTGNVPATTTAKPPPTAKPPAAGCNPPYTIDGNGVRHPKPECL